MASRLNQIEQGLTDTLLMIRKDTPSSYGYLYLNDITLVNCMDESLALAYTDYPYINFFQTDEQILGGEQRAYRSIAKYRLECRVAVDDLTPQPRFAINAQMNDMLDDLKAVLSDNYHLQCNVDRADIKYSRRIYNDESGHNLRVGQLQVDIDILYSQSRQKPDTNACL